MILTQYKKRLIKWERMHSTSEILKLQPFIINTKKIPPQAWYSRMEGRLGVRGGAQIIANNPIQGSRGVYKLTIRICPDRVATYIGLSCMVADKSIEERIALHCIEILARPLVTETAKIIKNKYKIKNNELARAWFAQQDFSSYEDLHFKFFGNLENERSKKVKTAREIIESGVRSFEKQKSFMSSNMHVEIYPINITDPDLTISAIQLLECIAVLEERIFESNLELNVVDLGDPINLAKKISKFKKVFLSSRNRDSFEPLFLFVENTPLFDVAVELTEIKRNKERKC